MRPKLYKDGLSRQERWQDKKCSQGLCIRCGNAPVWEGRVTCKECTMTQRAESKRYYEKVGRKNKMAKYHPKTDRKRRCVS